mmetsp:Transcript_47817/g.63204  ORF Transcript_47817/g.63204 Transcript_47817/m.63204 type:complete len:93 (+) Transcript_47817:3590-3868(+)
MFERLRGIVLNEDDETQDYELVVTADSVSMRGLRNQASRMAPEDRIILAYGRNIDQGAAVVKDLLKLCRKQQEQRKALKRREDVSAGEEAAL